MESNQKALVAIIVGTGAVENSWNPVIRALKSFSQGKVTEVNANSILARVVYEMRLNASGSPDQSLESQGTRLIKRYNSLKSLIASEVSKSELNGELKGRDTFNFIFDKLVIPMSNGFTFFTTNWDNVAENRAKKAFGRLRIDIPAFHIHGDCKSGNSLYLPSEVSMEAYRTKNEQRLLVGKHIGMIKALQEAKRLILFGVSLSPLDAELSHCIAEGVEHGLIKEIYIIDPNHNEVAQLLHVIIINHVGIKILGIDPTSKAFKAYA